MTATQLKSKQSSISNSRIAVLIPTLIFFFRLPISHSSSSFPKPPPLPILPVPSANQLSWQLSEMALFFHFGPNTFTDTEWGTGHADPSVFLPTSLDAAQWITVAKDNGFSRVILTAKHHDGFCLWPSQYTDYSVKSSPWKNGNGDVVAELAAAAKAAGIQLGLYLSPWDRHEPSYGKTLEYNEYYMGQMTELLTRYGEVVYIFLDGAKGDGEKDMEYYFESWFSLVKQLQPGAVIFSDAGPGTRWVGDEAGFASTTCWSLFNITDVEIGGDNDLSYAQGGDPFGRDWLPPECDVSIRTGWFWHPYERPKSSIELLDLYYKSLGRNCHLLLNIPPNSSGLISEADINVLKEFTRIRTSIFSINLAKTALISASSTRGPHFGSELVLEEDIYTYWAPDENQLHWELFLDFEEKISFNVLKIQEPIQMGQRIIRFHLDYLNYDGEWQKVLNGTTVGYRRILIFPKVVATRLRLVIEKSRADPLVSYLGIYFDAFTILGNGLNDTQILRQVTRNVSRVGLV
jgi:alpha-L-fucosidase